MDLRISSNYTFAFKPPSIDEEEKEIMARLRMYGVIPTGDKSADKAKLRQIEEKKAKENNYVSGKFLTISRNEEEKIQEKKKELRKLNNTDGKTDKKSQIKPEREGAKLRGEQIYLAIKMKNTNYEKRQ